MAKVTGAWSEQEKRSVSSLAEAQAPDENYVRILGGSCVALGSGTAWGVSVPWMNQHSWLTLVLGKGMNHDHSQTPIWALAFSRQFHA